MSSRLCSEECLRSGEALAVSVRGPEAAALPGGTCCSLLLPPPLRSASSRGGSPPWDSANEPTHRVWVRREGCGLLWGGGPGSRPAGALSRWFLRWREAGWGRGLWRGGQRRRPGWRGAAAVAPGSPSARPGPPLPAQAPRRTRPLLAGRARLRASPASGAAARMRGLPRRRGHGQGLPPQWARTRSAAIGCRLSRRPYDWALPCHSRPPRFFALRPPTALRLAAASESCGRCDWSRRPVTPARRPIDAGVAVRVGGEECRAGRSPRSNKIIRGCGTLRPGRSQPRREVHVPLVRPCACRLVPPCPRLARVSALGDDRTGRRKARKDILGRRRRRLRSECDRGSSSGPDRALFPKNSAQRVSVRRCQCLLRSLSGEEEAAAAARRGRGRVSERARGVPAPGAGRRAGAPPGRRLRTVPRVGSERRGAASERGGRQGQRVTGGGSRGGGRLG